MKKLALVLALFAGNALAAMPCQWQSNWGTIKFITPAPMWSSVRIGLTGGQTSGSTTSTFNLAVPTNDPVRLELFQQMMDLLKDAQSRGAMVSIETTGEACYKGVPLPNVSFITSQVWWK